MNETMRRSTTIVVGHGSRDAEANAAFAAWMELYAALYPERRLRYGFLELARPFLSEVLEEEAERNEEILVAPLSLLPAAHIKNDIPLAITAVQNKYPALRILATQAFGVHEKLIQHWVEQLAALRLPAEERKDWILLCVGRGSSDGDANSSFYKIARLIAEALGFPTMLPAFIGITWPSMDEALQLLAKQRPKGVVMLPYFLFSGVLVHRITAKMQEFAASYPWIKQQALKPFGVDRVLCDVLEDRIAEAQGNKEMALPCVSCAYRVPLGQLQGQVGGLKSLLWSVRHQFTHQQAMPHQHAHTPLQKHILVCTNSDCAARGSVQIAHTLQGALRKKGRHRDIRVTRTSCLGRCGEGPTVAVYPDGVWYRAMDVASAEALVEQHILNDRLLADKVDSLLS